MATYNKFNCFVADVHNGVHNLGSNTIKVALTNSAPSAANTQLSNITEIAYTYCSARVITVTSSSQSGGLYKLIVEDLTLTATGGAVGPFQYVVFYNDTHANKPLICWFADTAPVTLNAGDTYKIDCNQTDGLFDDQ